MSDQATSEQNAKNQSKADEEPMDVLLGEEFAVVDSVNVKVDEGGDAKPESKSLEKKCEQPKESKADGNVDPICLTDQQMIKTILSGDSAEKKAPEETPKESKDEKPKLSEKNASKADEDKKTPVLIECKEQKSLAKSPTKSSEKKEAKKEPANEKTEITKEDDRKPLVNGDDKPIIESKDDSLVITAEEDIDVNEKEINTATESKKESKSEKKTKTESSKQKKKLAPSVWVSNVPRFAKAADLKKLFSKQGRVVTARIVSNGRSFFGYVCMDSAKIADHCTKTLDGSKWEGKTIVVTRERPDPKRIRQLLQKHMEKEKEQTKKTEDDVKDKKKDPLTVKYEDKKTSSRMSSIDKQSDSRSKNELNRKDQEIRKLKDQIKLYTRNMDKLRKLLRGEQDRYQIQARRYERQFKELNTKLSNERRRFEKEREQLLKKNRLEIARLETDRLMLEKDREEIRRMRQEFERDVRKFAETSRRRRSVTPPPAPHRTSSSQRTAHHQHSHSAKSRSPSPVRQTKRFRPAEPAPSVVSSKHHDSSKKSSKWPERSRTPPTAPKLTEEIRSKRDSGSDRYYEDRRRDTTVYVPPSNFHEDRNNRRRPQYTPDTKSAIVVPSSQRNAGWGDVGSSWSGSGAIRDSAQYTSSASRYHHGETSVSSGRGAVSYGSAGHTREVHVYPASPPRRSGGSGDYRGRHYDDIAPPGTRKY